MNQPAAPEQLDARLTCRSCGYLLRGLAPERCCPECGEPIAASVAWEHHRGEHGVHPLSRSCAKLLRRVGVGCLLVSGSAVALAGASTLWPWPSRAAFHAVWLPIVAVWFAGLWALLQAGLVHNRRWLVIVVLAARALAVVWFLCFAVDRVVELVVGRVSAVVLLLGMTQLASAALATTFAALYLDHLALRAGRPLGRVMALSIAFSFAALAILLPLWSQMREWLGLWRTPWPVYPFIGTAGSSPYGIWAWLWVLRNGGDPEFWLRQHLFPALFDVAGCLILIWFGVLLLRAARDTVAERA